MKAIADRPLTVREIKLRQHGFYEASRGIISLMADLYSLGRPFMIIKDGAVVEHGTRFTEEQEAVLRQCRELLDQLRESYGLTEIC